MVAAAPGRRLLERALTRTPSGLSLTKPHMLWVL